MSPARFLSAGVAALALVAAAPAMAQTAAPAAAAQAGAPSIERSVKVAPGGLYEIAFNPADGQLYVAATGPRGANAAQVVRLDARSLDAGAAIAVAEAPLYGLALNARAQVLYGTATAGGSLTAIDLRTGRVTAGIKPEGAANTHVRQVLVDEADNTVYATIVGHGEGAEAQPSQVWVIDGATNAGRRIITVPTETLTGAALSGDGRLFVTGMGSNEVLSIDLSTDRVVGRWPAGGERPTNVAHDAAGDRLFVTNQGSGTLSVLNASTGALIRTVPTGEGALAVLHDPRRDRLYVTNRGAGTVTVIDATTYAVLGNLETGTFPQSLALDPATGAVFVTNKARGLPRNAPAGTPVPVDPNGDTVTVIRP